MAFFNHFNTININYCCFNGLNNWFANAFNPVFTPAFTSAFTPVFNFFPALTPLFPIYPMNTSSFTPKFNSTFTSDFDNIPMPDFSSMPKVWDTKNNNIWDPVNTNFKSNSTTFNSQSNISSFDKFVHTTPAVSKAKSTKINFSNNTLKLDNYNESAGKKLAEIALENTHHDINKNNRKIITSSSKNPDKFTGNCARYVKIAIRDAGLGDYTSGHAYQLADSLRNNKNFQEISPNGVDVKKLPAGCVLVYGKGVENYSKDYGHVEITLGNSKAVSDGTTNNLYKTPSKIFVPISIA